MGSGRWQIPLVLSAVDRVCRGWGGQRCWDFVGSGGHERSKVLGDANSEASRSLESIAPKPAPQSSGHRRACESGAAAAWCVPHPQNLCLKEKIQTAWLPSSSFSLQAAPPRPTNRYSEPHTERAAPRCLFSHHTKLWEKVPGHLLFFAQTAETRRHRSTAADLGRQSLVCPFQPRPSRSRPSIFSSADLQSLTFPGRRPHGRRYESALWLLGAGALHFGGGELFDGGAAAGRSGLGASRLTREISSRSYSYAIACGPSSSGGGPQVTRRGLFSVRGGRLQHNTLVCCSCLLEGGWLDTKLWSSLEATRPSRSSINQVGVGNMLWAPGAFQVHMMIHLYRVKL